MVCRTMAPPFGLGNIKKAPWPHPGQGACEWKIKLVTSNLTGYEKGRLNLSSLSLLAAEIEVKL